jgi:CDP-diacylglycerol--glycerol-3-phosphate 3-phosphatidyltransferase
VLIVIINKIKSGYDKFKLVLPIWLQPFFQFPDFFLGIFTFYEIYYQKKYVLSAYLIVLGALTDFLDGWIARNFKQKTRLGAQLDHIGDKFFVLLVLFAFYLTKRVEFLPLLLLTIREIGITLLRFYGLASSVSFLGKIKTTVEFLALFFLCTEPFIGKILLWLSVFLAYLSGFMYIKLPQKAVSRVVTSFRHLITICKPDRTDI